MALRVWDPFSTLARLDREVDELFRRTWTPARTAAGRRAQGSYVPAVDIARDGDDAVLTLELPGVDVEKDVEVEVASGRLTISGKREERTSTENGGTTVRELRYGSFRREFALPDDVKADAVTASYDKGLLEVRISGAARPAVEARKIPVLSGSSRPAVEANPES
ncbi:Hsp20/alpha crystallin family protein [Flindersiella endophytica]